MRNTLALLVLSCLIPLPSVAAEGSGDYQSWCNRRADGEQITAKDRAEYVSGCIDKLVQADRKPERSGAKKQSQDDEG